jgi:hypothetical protein
MRSGLRARLLTGVSYPPDLREGCPAHEAEFDRIANIVLEADYLDVLQLSEERICEFLRARCYATEVCDQTIYGWR